MDYLELGNIIVKNSNAWNKEDIAAWLKFIDLEKYVDIFRVNNIDGTNLKSLGEESIRKMLNTKSNIVIKKLNYWIEVGLKQFDKMLKQGNKQNGQSTERTKKVEDNGSDNNIEEERYEEDKKYQLVLQQSNNSVFVYYSIDENGGKLGRLTTNKVCIPHQDISRQHAEIKYRDQMFYLQDLGSNGGTYLKLENQIELTHGIIFEIGSIEFYVYQNQGKLFLERRDQTNNIVSLNLTDFPYNHLKIGRNGDNGFNFPSDTIMSNIHCIIQKRNNKPYLSDNASTNGTWLRLSLQSIKSQPFVLHDNTHIRIGDNIIYRVYKKLCQKPVLKSNNRQCRVCYDTEKDCVILPCKHYNFCTKCSRHFRSCPICRNPIQEIMKIYHQ